MGQRHQLFIIAKVGLRYRVLAAVHHQWLYGGGAVAQCLHILRLLQSNAPLLRQEMQGAGHFGWDTLTPQIRRTWVERQAMTERDRAEVKADDVRAKTSFPLITTCLMTGAAKNSSAGFSRVHILPVTCKPRDCDNNDGYTIFDVTDPEQPRYCFMVFDDVHSEPYEPRFVKTMAPITAIDYLFLYEIKAWQAKGNDLDCSSEGSFGGREDFINASDEAVKADIRERLSSDSIIKDLADYALIHPDALLSAWPEEKFAKALRMVEEPSVQAFLPRSQSLRAGAMDEVISRALQNDTDDLSWLSQAEQLPDFSNKAFAELVLHPEAITEPAGFSLLCRALKDRRNIDLSYFSRLTVKQILRILSELRDGHITLILPRLDSLTALDVRSMIQSSKVVDLRFGYTPGLDLATLINALSGGNLQMFSHPQLFESSLLAFYRIPDDIHGLATTKVSKILNAHPLSQAVYLGTTSSMGGKSPHSTLDPSAGRELPRCASGAVAWAQHFSAMPDDEHYTGVGRLNLPWEAQVLPIPLLDIPLSTRELLPRLFSAIAKQIVGSERLSGVYADIGSGLAMSIAISDNHEIFPVPAELYCSYMIKGRNSVEPPPMIKPVIQGEWTLLICQERQRGCEPS